jgi:WD40 repeat protein
MIVVAGVLAYPLAREPSLTAVAVVVLLLVLAIVRFAQAGARIVFSLKAILLVTGLIACELVLRLTGEPWREVHRFPGFEVITAMSADGKWVAASQGTSIEIRETKTGRTVQTIKMPAAEAALKASQRWAFKMAFSEDGKSLMTVDWQTHPCWLDIATGKEKRRWSTSPGICPLASSGNRFLENTYVVPSNGTIACNIFDVEQEKPLLTIECKTLFYRVISPKGTYVLVGKDQADIEIWHVDEKRKVGSVPVPQNNPAIFNAVFTRDERYLAIPTGTGIAIWDLQQFEMIAEWNPKNFAHATTLQWSPDGKRLVVSYIELIGPTSGPGVVAGARNAIEHGYLLDRSCREIASLEGTSGVFSPTGDRIATIFNSAGVFINDGKSGKPLSMIAARPMEIVLGGSTIQFTPDGDWMFVNGTPTVYRRTRSEFWYSIYMLPAFWGMVLFLSALIVQLCEAVLVKRAAKGNLPFITRRVSEGPVESSLAHASG